MSHGTTLTGLVVAIATTLDASGVLASGETPTPHAPSTVSDVVWSIELDAKPLDAVSTQAGAAFVLADGLVAIDGVTGETMWQYDVADADAVAIMSSPDGVSLLLTTASGDETSIVGLDSATGRERFAMPFVLDDPEDPDDEIAVTNHSFAVAEGPPSTVRAYSIESGSDLWAAELPDECPEFTAWWGNDQAAPSGVVVMCADFDAETTDVARGGFLLLDSRTGDVVWRHLRNTMLPRNPPEVGPDGAMVTTQFADLTGGEGPAVFEAILSLDSGEVIAEGEFRGHLAFDGWFVHVNDNSTDTDAVFENVRTGDRIDLPAPCPCARSIAYLPDGLLWWKRAHGAVAAELEFRNIREGSTTTIAVPQEFAAGQTLLGGGSVILSDFDSDLLLGVR